NADGTITEVMVNREISDLDAGEWTRLFSEGKLAIKKTGGMADVGARVSIGSTEGAGALYNITKETFEKAYESENYLVAVAGELKKGSDLAPNEIDALFSAGTTTVYPAKEVIKESRPLLQDAETRSLKNVFIGEMGSKIGDQYKNADEAVAMLLSKKVKTRPFFSAVDYFAGMSTDFFDYYSTKQGFLKWTVTPFAAWHLKKGLGEQKASTYLLPAEWKWTEVIAEQGTAPVYDDAYIDFFSHEGSDESDLFKNFINSWAFIYTNVARTVGESLDIEAPMNAIAGSYMKHVPDNLAFYVSGPKDCASCSLTSSIEGTSAKLGFLTGKEYNAYLLENTKGTEGQALAGFTHHSDIRGERTGESGLTNINLAESQRTGAVCSQKLSELGGPFGIFAKAGAAIFGSESAGAAIGAESLTTLAYVLPNIVPIPGFSTWAGFGIGTAFSILEQQYFSDKLAGCVDDEEGYYMHMFIPFKKSQPSNTQATEQLGGLINQGKNAISSVLGADLNNSAFSQQMDGVKKQVDKLLGNASAKDIVEAIVSFDNANGVVTGINLFYLWVQGKGVLQPSTYEQASKALEFINDPASGIKLEFNGPEGSLKANGVEIIGPDKADFVRLSTTDLGIPAKIIPMKLSYVQLPGSNSLMFDIDEKGTLTVKDSSVLECIKQAVKNQSGRELTSSNLRSFMGSVTKVITTTHKQVVPTGSGIIANDVDRKIINGEGAIEVLGSRETLIKPHDNPSVGRMISVQFSNGFIIYKPESNELILWIKNTAELSASDIGSAEMKLTTATNPLNNCAEPAVNFKVNGMPENELSQKKADEFNQSLDSVGPFQMLETQTNTFIFYSELVNGECKQKMKVINKKTGEVKDYGIQSIEETPNGCRVIDDTGKPHDFEFSAEDGRPLLKYNDLVDTLLKAQGRNGAFWFDPEKGMWYTTNGQLIPLLEAFKQAGLTAKANPDGTVTGTAAGNPLFVQPVSAGGPNFLASLPSVPEDKLLLLLFIAGIVGLAAFMRTSKRSN
ncbi:hypothetical protein HZB89_00430, partial [archaeon]|nr:hypothetical protein [archaeon]